jgi:hypothetical protein
MADNVTHLMLKDKLTTICLTNGGLLIKYLCQIYDMYLNWLALGYLLLMMRWNDLLTHFYQIMKLFLKNFSVMAQLPAFDEMFIIFL